jgi:polygalacturonase
MNRNFLRIITAAFLFSGLGDWAIAQSPGPQGRPVYNIMDFGAHNDGSGNAADAFRAAIAAVKKAGGGTVFVPAGHYVSGPIEMVSNMTLYFDAGAIVQFPAVMLPFTKGTATRGGDADAGSTDWRARPRECDSGRARRSDE